MPDPQAMRIARLVATAALVLAAHPSWAQEAKVPAAEREVVEVTLTAPEKDLKGKLISFDDQTLSIEIDRRRVDVPMARVVLIEKRVRDSPWNGALLMGAFLAACARWWCEQGVDSSTSAVPRTIGGAAVGAAYGFLIDWLIHGHEVMFEAPPAAAAAPRPGLGIAVAVRF